MTNDEITIGILAGGKARRMNNADKGLVKFKNKRFIDHILDEINKDSVNIIISSNRNIDEYNKLQKNVYKDEFEGYQGPLAGIYTLLNNCKTDILITVPCDAPFIKCDFFYKMMSSYQKVNSNLLIAKNNRPQPVFMLLDKSLLGSMKIYMENNGRKIDEWYFKENYKYIEFDDSVKYFHNLNTLDDLNDGKK